MDFLGGRRFRIELLLFLPLAGTISAACSPPASSAGAQSALQIAPVPVVYSGEVASFDNGLLLEYPFLDAYKGMEGERWLGRPVTRAFADRDLGWTLQIYEYGVLAQDPGDGHIFLIKISDLLGRRQAGVPPSKDSNCSYSQETGHNLCYEFREYIRTAGVEHFGPPVAEMMMDADGILFQDFEYARLQWVGGGIIRERCGETFFLQRGYDRALREPAVESAGPAAGVTRLYASLARPTLRPGEMQTLQVALTDATGAGITGVALQVTLEKEGQALLEIALPPTDASGMASLSFRVPDADPGTRIRVIVRGAWESTPLEAVVEFEVWW
ncbi:MAG: hypothetical protein JW929_02965 [Anaerolineales bacterium]|nr:hypothetical protein [Anaerolineales bacterium]